MKRNTKLLGRRVLITGGGSGIGRAVAVEAARRGAKPILIGRREKMLAETLDLLPPECDGWSFPCDITDADARTALLRRMAERKDGVDILVNNAGAITVGPLVDQDDAAIMQMVAVNLAAPAMLIRDFLPLLRQSDAPCIVNVGSIFGDIAYPDFAVYSATKYGLRGLSDAMRRELREDGVQVTYVAPRGTDTPSVGDQGDELNKHDARLDPPEAVAHMLWDAVERGARSAYPTVYERLQVALQRILPGLLDAHIKA